MNAPEDPPSWGQLIDTERDRLRPAISQNEAAKRAGISGTRWRQIVDGRAGAMDSDRGTQTLARMAEVAGVRPAQLEEKGRRDVADELRLLLGENPAAAGASLPSMTANVEGAESGPLAGLPDERGERIAALSERLNDNAEEQRLIAAELARLLGRTDPGAARRSG